MGATNDLIQVERAFQFVYGDGPNVWHFRDDFNDLNISASGANYSGTERWSHLSTDSGNTAKLVNTLGGGVLALSYSSPTDEDVISLIGNGGIITGTDLQPNTPIRFGARFQMADVDGADFFIGLSIFDHSIPASAPADFVGFQVLASEASGDMNLVTSKNSVLQYIDPVCTLANATWVRAFFEFWPTAGNTDSGTLYVKVHHNGSVYRNTLTVSNTFPDDVWIAPIIQTQIEGTDEDVQYVDWIDVKAVRADYVDGTG